MEASFNDRNGTFILARSWSFASHDVIKYPTLIPGDQSFFKKEDISCGIGAASRRWKCSHPHLIWMCVAYLHWMIMHHCSQDVQTICNLSDIILGFLMHQDLYEICMYSGWSAFSILRLKSPALNLLNHVLWMVWTVTAWSPYTAQIFLAVSSATMPFLKQ